METTARHVECWLPDLQRFDPAHPLRALLHKGDHVANGAQGYLGGLSAYFRYEGELPAAALIRFADKHFRSSVEIISKLDQG